MNGLIISFSVAVNGAQNFLTLVYFLCSVCMLLNSQMAEINGNYIFPKFKSDFFIMLIFFFTKVWFANQNSSRQSTHAPHLQSKC